MHAPNTDVAIYVPPNGAPNAPDALVRGSLQPAWRPGMQVNEWNRGHTRDFFFTDVLEVPVGTDARDSWPLVPGNFLYVPDATGQQYLIVFVERVRPVPRGKDYLKVYLRRTIWNVAGGGAMEVKQANNTPDLLNITTLIIDQAHALAVTQPAVGQAQIAVVNQMSIAVDANGLKLVGDSASPGNSKLYGTNGSGVKGWYDQPVGGGGIGALVFSADSNNVASINMTGLTGYKWYKLIGFDLRAKHSGGANLWLRTSTDGGSTFDAGFSDYATNIGSDSKFNLNTLPDDSASTHTVAFEMILWSLSSASLVKPVHWRAVGFDGSLVSTTDGSGLRTTTSAINALQLLADTGNLNGSVRVYGYN
jgi:hypothetical protein